MPYSDAEKQAEKMIEINDRRRAAEQKLFDAIYKAGWQTIAEFSSAIETGAVKLPRKSKQSKTG